MRVALLRIVKVLGVENTWTVSNNCKTLHGNIGMGFDNVSTRTKGVNFTKGALLWTIY